MKNIFLKSILLAAISIGNLASAWELSPTVGAGFEFGGDKLVTLRYTDGSESDIKAGQGILLFGGLNISEGEFQFEPRLGIKFASTKEAKNGDVTWTRVPVELLAFWKPTDIPFRFGGGLTYQVANKLKGTKDASIINADVKNALGFIVEGGWIWTTPTNLDLGVSLRYTMIDYKAKLAGSKTVDGDSFGLSAQLLF